MSNKKYIISVGYILDLEPFRNQILELMAVPNEKREYYQSSIYAGVWYGEFCRGGLDDAMKNQSDLNYWYSKQRNKVFTCKIRELYMNKRKTLLVAEIRTSADAFFAFLYNRDGVATTMQKKQIINGNGSWSKIELPEHWMVPMKPYIHYSDYQPIRF